MTETLTVMPRAEYDLSVSGAGSPMLTLNELVICYAAFLPRRGPHIASHSVCLSVCPSVPLADVLCLQLHRLTSEHPK